MKLSKPILIYTLFIALAVGFAGGWLMKPAGGSGGSNQDTSYPLLAKRIFLDNPNDVIINFVSLRKKLTDQFKSLNTQQSVYFEYLPDGTSIRIGADQNLVAASLLKVPLVMNFYRAAEMNKINMDSTVTITNDDIDKNFGDLWQKGAGSNITLRQAAALALENSDNTATRVIFNHTKGLLGEDDQALQQLDIDQDAENGEAVITARAYSSVLKSLYLASYLSKTDSQELLGYLSKSSETNRLTKDLPKTVTVAHKNGVYNSGGLAQSDCGIFYVPNRPYILCIMVGLPEDQADSVIAQTSKEVYDFVTTR